jgi:hypothetical protein
MEYMSNFTKNIIRLIGDNRDNKGGDKYGYFNWWG